MDISCWKKRGGGSSNHLQTYPEVQNSNADRRRYNRGSSRLASHWDHYHTETEITKFLVKFEASDLHHQTADCEPLSGKMAGLVDLSVELIVLIASNIRKPSHLLQLALPTRAFMS